MTGPDTFALTASFGEDALPVQTPRAAPERMVGLGTGIGGQITRTKLGMAGASALKDAKNMELQAAKSRRQQCEEDEDQSRATTPRPQVDSLNSESMLKHSEPRGMWFGLLLNDMGAVTDEELERISSHRWNFQGAVELASQGRSICYFIWCLLELQRNIQLNEEGDVLDPKLIAACQSFVKCQCREGRMGEMYQVLTHFISNSVVFTEWDRFLAQVFADARASQEAFLVEHLTEVWSRFTRLKALLESIFDILDTRYVWRHRLPKVGELVHDHMKRRCFSSEAVAKNEFFASSGTRDETLKTVKFSMGYG